MRQRLRQECVSSFCGTASPLPWSQLSFFFLWNAIICKAGKNSRGKRIPKVVETRHDSDHLIPLNERVIDLLRISKRHGYSLPEQASLDPCHQFGALCFYLDFFFS